MYNPGQNFTAQHTKWLRQWTLLFYTWIRSHHNVIEALILNCRTPPLPLAMLLATKILQTRHQHCKGVGKARKRVSDNCSKLSHYFWPGLSENVFRIKRIYNSTIKEDMFHVFTNGCDTIFWTHSCYICDVLVEFEEKIVGIFAYREVYGVPHIFVLHV